MNKPCGYVCAAASDSHKTVYELLTPELQELVSEAPRGCRLHTVGRLDCDTSGLLLITNDGNFSNKITAGAVVKPESTVVECPTGRIETTVNLEKVVPPGGFDTASGLLNHRLTKTYRAKLAAPVSVENQKEYINRAATGLILPPEKKYGEQKALPATIIFETASICKITVTEGKFHEVRRIFRALGNEVTELERLAIGKLELPPDLKAGQWRPLTDDEKELLMFL
ncbi:pseudouridine synthase [Treponema bryantii]|uniref:pseudouridine synthase n=1 Tax=Treponema bryantii TaxID=163 RepID=UPI0012DBEEDA|nr:pseudouridine synthase [Treponema bryantii]